MSIVSSVNTKNINYEKIYLYLLLTFAFTLPLSRAAISFFTILLPFIWLIEGDFKRKFEQIKDSKVVLILALFIVFGYLSLSWTGVENLKDGLSTATKPLRLILIPLVIIITTLKPKYISKIITAFLMGMLISEILSYGIFFELWILPFGYGSPLNPTPIMYHLDYSTFLSFTALLLLNRFFTTSDLRWKSFYFIYFLFVASNLFLNGGRTGQLAFAVSIFIVGFLNIKNKFKALILMFVLVFAIFYSSYQISPVFKMRFDQATHEISKIKNNDPSQFLGSFGQRMGAWIVSKDIILDNFFLGTGAGSSNKKLHEYSQNHENKIYHSIKDVFNFHNQFVQIFVRVGLIGFILYMTMWLYISKIVIKDKYISNLRYIFITVFFVASTVENIFENQFPMTLFSLFVGIFIIMSRENEKYLFINREQA